MNMAAQASGGDNFWFAMKVLAWLDERSFEWDNVR
jgi:hypothetical protein